MSTYLVKVGTTYQTVRALQAAVTLNPGDIVQLDDSAGAITETSSDLDLKSGVTYTSFSSTSKAVWHVNTMVAYGSYTTISKLNFSNSVYSGTLLIPNNDPINYAEYVTFDSNYVQPRQKIMYINDNINYSGRRWIIRNNIFNHSAANASNIGLDFKLSGWTWPMWIYNNIIISTNYSSGSIALNLQIPVWPVSLCSVKNNVLYGDGNGIGIKLSETMPYPDVDYNCVYNYSTNIQIPSGGTYGSHNLVGVDPLFVSVPSNLHFQSSSPCKTGGINHNSDSNVPLTDFDGANRLISDVAMGSYATASVPGAVVLVAPISGVRVADNTPTLTFIVPSDPNNKSIVFRVELDTVNPVNPSSSDYKKFESRLSQGTWQYWNGGLIQDIPTGGLGPTFYGTDATFTVPNVSRLRNAIWYWKVCVSNELDCCTFNNGIFGQKKFCNA